MGIRDGLVAALVAAEGGSSVKAYSKPAIDAGCDQALAQFRDALDGGAPTVRATGPAAAELAEALRVMLPEHREVVARAVMAVASGQAAYAAAAVRRGLPVPVVLRLLPTLAALAAAELSREAASAAAPEMPPWPS
jgi:hypothetical protein